VPGSPAALSTGSAVLGALSKTGPFAYKSREDGLSRVLLTEMLLIESYKEGPRNGVTAVDRSDKFVNNFDKIVDKQESRGLSIVVRVEVYCHNHLH
jgi:hypothetical protein